MKLVQHAKGLDYEYCIFDNVIRNYNDLDVHQLFNDYSNEFEFKDNHVGHKLRQYNSDARSKKIMDEIDEDVTAILGDNWIDRSKFRKSYGLHELFKSDKNEYDGAIPPHRDVGHLAGFTCFLNRDWDLQRGGWNYIISYEEDRVIITDPKPNRGILIFGGTLHGAMPCWNQGLKRRTLQLFWTKL